MNGLRDKKSNNPLTIKELVNSAPLYTFCAFADAHIDICGFFTNAERHWGEALSFAEKSGVEFILLAGDTVTNASGADEEWEVFHRVIRESGCKIPVYTSNGNHDLRCGTLIGQQSFLRARSLEKPYFSFSEKSTGDLFIFMAIEGDYDPSCTDQFSEEQLLWVEKLIDENYGKRRIFLIEHCPIESFGVGVCAHGVLLSEKFGSTKRLKGMLEKYKDLIFLSGHSHEDFSVGNNYTNLNGSACHMLHIPALAGSALKTEDGGLDYNNGEGYNAQGYYVEVFENRVVFNGVDVESGELMPEYKFEVSVKLQ